MDISREELFELVWSEPASTVAERLGISDVALGKLCSRLQVPKPPRGYWARKRAGKAAHRPALPAFIEETERRRAQRNRRNRQEPRLSPRRRELFDKAVQYLRKDASTEDDFIIRDGRLTSIDPDFAAALVIAIGQNYRKWGLPEGAGGRAEQGLEGAVQRLIEALIPLTADRVVIFSPPNNEVSGARHYLDTGKHAVVRFTPELVRTVAQLARTVRNHGLDFVAYKLDSLHQFWRVRWVHDPSRVALGKTRLCISCSEAWVRYDGLDWFGDQESLETAAVPLEKLAPIDLLGETEIDATSVRLTTYQEPYSSRLHALRQAEQAYDIAESAQLDGESALDRGTLTKMLSLWLTEENLAALRQLQTGLRNITLSMERWREALDRETEALCLEVLGVYIGDCILLAGDDRNRKLRLDSVNLLFDDKANEVVFLLNGCRYRKDGLPGKRGEVISISVPWTDP